MKDVLPDLTFQWLNGESLTDVLKAPFVKASVNAHAVNGIYSITFWQSENYGLQISSNMNTIAFRDEVGVLSFNSLEGPCQDSLIVDLPPSFLGARNLIKLVSDETDGQVAEAGFIMQLPDNQEITILAGSFPLTLSICGLAEVTYPFSPERNFEHYRHVSF